MSMIWVDHSEYDDEVMQSVGYYHHTDAPLVDPPCMICGVSFNIRRHRTAGEPSSAAFFSHARVGPGEYPGSQKCVQPDCHSIPSPRNLGSEHISGPSCRSTNAYHGSRISVEAMRECSTYQCLLIRKKSWNPPESELEDFEKQGRYALSGLGDAMESDRRRYDAQVFPARNNVHYSRSDTRFLDMAFHPACFEVYKRASIYRYGFVNTNALVSWGQLRKGPKFKLPEHAAVKRASRTHWVHHAGDEFLVANPCFIPGLQDILDSVQDVCTPGDICSDATYPAPNSTDIFSKFPQEIKLEILLQLDSWDIANLRLSSRTFRHLPQSLFYHLTLRELPWLYEAWTSLPLSFFVTTTAAEQRRLGKPLFDIQEELWERREDDNGSEEDAAEINRLVGLAAQLEERQRQGYATTPVRMLDRRRTNWTHLRGELTRRWAELPGLRNRRKIWNNCQEIMDRAETIPY
ncbi:hypothetical protein FMEXI_8624 [Fusarium mexicanum]|uniref:F-box domain-containing protein n=1 Tax=Fusarium mexicanum TaxID=751941 RepID=A0A8H5MTH4_9HYPO|nr:hypothetical protein FMEXI_8624 [Fusarium mexicanum]